MSQVKILPELDDLRLYLSRQGWQEGPLGAAGSLWSDGSIRLAVPRAAEDRSLIQGVVERLADLSNEDVTLVAERIRYYNTDVTDFRAATYESSADEIPLDVAEMLTRSARTLIRSAATTAAGPRGDLRGNYSRFSTELAAKAKMGHTKRGSFIIPILVPLPVNATNVAAAEANVLNEPFRVATPEPYERRAVRTLAQSLQAVQDVIIDPGIEPTMRVLHDAVELGVSRELCLAVGEILSHPSMSEFDASFRWGEAIKVPSKLPQTVRLPVEGHDLVSMASKRLREVQTERSRTFSGNIVALRHVADDPTGYITVSTIRHGRMAEVTVSLPRAIYRDALRWHDDARVILIEGDVTKEGGKLVVRQISRCHPIDDLLSHE